MKRLTFVAMVLCAGMLLGDKPAWQTAGMLPDTVRSPGNLTAAKWIWHPGIVTRIGEAYYRYAFDVSGDVKRATLKIAFDDQGEWYLNGVRQSGDGDVAAQLKPGRNVLAAHVKNYECGSGILVFGEVETAKGAKTSIRSSSAFRATAEKPSDGWMRTDFNDAAWGAAREITDAAGQPFSNNRDYLAEFATEAERQRVAAFVAAHPNRLPPGLAAEPEPRARIVYEGWMPKIEVNGVRYEPNIDANCGYHDYACNVVRKTASLGFVFDQIAVESGAYEKGPGQYDFSKFDLLARRILDCNPQARLFLVMEINIPKWCAVHPKALVGYGDGAIDPSVGDECTGRHPRPSAASPEYRAEVGRLLRQFAAYVRAQPWGKRVVAVRPCWGIYWEWHVFGMYHSPDVGPAMTAAFRRWKDGKYADTNPPTPAERTKGGYLLDPVKDAKVLDFYECQQSTVADFMIETARTIKDALPGRLVGMYYGYVVTFHPPEGANVMLDKVLAAPEIDFLSDPTMYSAGSRRAGGSHFHRTIPTTYHRYGKLSVAEDDMRHYHIRDYAEKQICTETPREARMTTRRNYLNRIFDGCGFHIFDPGGLSGVGTRTCTHDDPAVMRGLYEGMEMTRKAGTVAIESGNDTAVVVDWRERLRQDNKARGKPLTTALYGRGIEFAYRSGATFDLMTLDDYLAQKKRYAKVVLFNVFNPLPEHLAALKAKLARDGANTARFIFPGANEKAFGDSVWAIRDIPNSAREWADVFAVLGNSPIVRAGNYVRRQGNLLMFHTADAGRFELRLPVDLADVPAIELASGRAYRGASIFLETDGVDTLLFKFDRVASLRLAERGKPPAYKIFRSAADGPSYVYAAEELRDYVRKLTGVELPIVSERGEGPAIVLSPDETDGDAFRLQVRGDDLVIAGGVRGVLYGVYELLETFGGVSWYASWHEIASPCAALCVPRTLDRAEKPAFALREPFWKDAFVGDFAARLRANGNRAALKDRHGGKPHRFGGGLGNCHTVHRLLPADKYVKTHPEYWAMRNGVRIAGAPRAQLCLTNPDVLAIVTSNVLAAIASDPTAPYFGVSQDDSVHYCECPSCKAVDDAEGSHAGTFVRFVNAVNAAVKKVWPNVTIETLAYQYTRKPAKTPLNRDILPCLCTIECDFSKPLATSRFKENVSFLDDIRGWANQVDRLYVWDYVTDFHHFLKPFRNLHSIVDNIRFFKTQGVSQLFEQGAYKGWHGEMAELKAWLIAKAMWNDAIDPELAITRFLAGFYGKAAPRVHEYLAELYAVSATIDEVAHPATIFEDVSSDPVLTPEFLAWASDQWRRGEEAVADDPHCAYNVRMGALAIDYTRFMSNLRQVNLSTNAVRNAVGVEDVRRIVAAFDEAARAKRPILLCEDSSLDASRKAQMQEICTNGLTVIGDGFRARLPERMLSRGARLPGQLKIVDDPEAEDGKALWMKNDNYEWYTSFNFGHVVFDVGATYRLRVRAKADLTGATGEVFSAGFYDASVTKKTRSRSVKAKDVKPGYAWYDICTFAPTCGGTIFIAPGYFAKGKSKTSPVHNGVWVDAIEFERLP